MAVPSLVNYDPLVKFYPETRNTRPGRLFDQPTVSRILLSYKGVRLSDSAFRFSHFAVTSIYAGATDPIEAVKEKTNGAMSDTILEATGIPKLAAAAARMAAKGGEVVLIGTPRGPFDGNATDLLRP